MGFQNSAGLDANQAVALVSKSDRSTFYDVQITGYQDTLYAHSQRQFYTNCTISGTVDFIFGFSATIIQDCKIISKLPEAGHATTITAHGRKGPRQATGFVIQHCDIVANEKLYPFRSLVKSYLGRPWKKYSRTVVMESNIDDFIQPDGWLPWGNDFASLDTCFYAEYANVGPGANTDKRAKGKGVKVITDRNEAMNFTAGPFLTANQWLREPFYLGLFKGR
uniref:pectinesterase-like n=1 Tax=Erigeron canadensis TaxID=72917 RepID=UPI001CB89E84|nr:pectinesterase-like [Erigeron canadensis]